MSARRDEIVRRPERPFLTANWTELLLVNFAVPTEVIARLAPPGTVPDLFAAQAYASLVGFRFHKARVLGIAFPGHTRFEEVNLRFYVRREVRGESRRGVVFTQEVAPRRAVAFVANWMYNERYVTHPMACDIRMAGRELAADDSVEYRWHTGRGPSARWNGIAARVAGALRAPCAGSFEEYIINQYWGYGRTRDGGTLEYRVAHPPWRVAPVEEAIVDCDMKAMYKDTPLADYLTAPPVSALVADGSPIELFRGRRVTADIDATPQEAGRAAIRVKPGVIAEPA